MQKENYVIDKIEMLRKKRNLSRYRLARRSGLALSSVSNLLNRKNVPTIYTLEKLCAALGVTMAQFFSIDDTRPNLTKEQEDFLAIFDEFSDEEKARVAAFMQGMRKV